MLALPHTAVSMAATYWVFPQLLIWLLALVQVCPGGYVVTAPQRWSGGLGQVCVVVTDPVAPFGRLSLTLTAPDPNTSRNITLNNPTTIDIPPGRWSTCVNVSVKADGASNTGELMVEGQISGARVKHAASVTFTSTRYVTFIQTDKYLYQPGDTVRFRILTVFGPFFKVSTQWYPVVWLEAPSGTRVAQWTRVDNTGGLVHLVFTLADEPQQGLYTIFVKTEEAQAQTNFMVEKYVLPRFEVTVTPPRYLLASDASLALTVCARYTFGQPVRGGLRLEVTNGLSRKCRASLVKTAPIQGCREVVVKAEELLLEECGAYSVTGEATVTEAGTEVTAVGTTTLAVSRSPVVFTTRYKDQYMKPNLPFTVQVAAELPDGTPAAGVKVEACAAGVCTNLSAALDGSITLVLPSYKANRIFMKTLMCSARTDSSEYWVDIAHYVSPSNSSLLIHAPGGRLRCLSGSSLTHHLPVMFSATNLTRAFINVQVVSRGRIQYWKTEEYALVPGVLPISVAHLVGPLLPSPPHTVRGLLHLPITLPYTASPRVSVLVWYRREDGEVVADTRQLEVDKCLASGVNLAWSSATAQPRDTTTLAISSAPLSLCSVGVVDRSTELLDKRDDTITVDKIFELVNDYEAYPWVIGQDDCIKQGDINTGARLKRIIPNSIRFPIWPFPRASKYVDALQMFQIAGLHVFSDLKLVARPCEYQDDYIIPFYDGVARLGGGGGAAPAAPRTHFPETWLFDIFLLPSSGKRVKVLEVPDTITQWVGKAVCVTPGMDVGLSLPANLTTIMPFFLDLTIPPSVKRGEVLPVKISVFNYLNRALPVRVRMEESREYQVVGGGVQEGVCVAAQDMAVVTIRLNMLALGDVKINVSAHVDNTIPGSCGSRDTPIKSDAVVKAIKVDAEGFPREKTWTSYLCSQGNSSGRREVAWTVGAAEAAVVDGSARAWVTIGGLLVLSLQNLGNLVRQPSGCGEQNMVNFAPNIFILQYLKATGQDTPEVTDRLVRFMTTGYQRELLYLRDDGSFSVFGRADESGSTWLTAFVLKSFALARPFILVDEKVLNKSRSWLGRAQGPDGCFVPLGMVIHKEMKGGIGGKNSSVPLTAYVMISLLEAGEDLHSPTVLSAAGCLAGDSSLSPYTLALKAYALTLARLPAAQTALQEILDQAVVTKDYIYWELPSSRGRNLAVEVETAGYVVLSMMSLYAECFFQHSTKIVQWLMAQRNGQGGFFSTQDTVVALQALASYESRLRPGPVSVVGRVKANLLSYDFAVNDSNQLVEQRVTLPIIPTNVSITVDGHGCTVLQAVLRYNVAHPAPSDVFNMTIVTAADYASGCVTQNISACVAYVASDAASGMVVVEVNLVSGYVPVTSYLSLLNTGVKRYEAEGSRVSFYLEQVTARARCVTVVARREVAVGGVKPATVLLYDYYNPHFSLSQDYRLIAAEDCE
nr:pregnancy zone protein-like [Procambarus clarkii]